MRTSRRDTQWHGRTTFVISVPLFFAAVFLGLPSIACRTSRRDRLCEVRTAAVISIHFAGILMLGAESEGDEQRAEEESDNLFSRVSRRCCSYAASFFVYHVRIGEAFFLPAGPWDQTGFHRRGAVTEYTKPDPEASKFVERWCVSGPRDVLFEDRFAEGESILPRRFVTHFAVVD